MSPALLSDRRRDHAAPTSLAPADARAAGTAACCRRAAAACSCAALAPPFCGLCRQTPSYSAGTSSRWKFGRELLGRTRARLIDGCTAAVYAIAFVCSCRAVGRRVASQHSYLPTTIARDVLLHASCMPSVSRVCKRLRLHTFPARNGHLFQFKPANSSARHTKPAHVSNRGYSPHLRLECGGGANMQTGARRRDAVLRRRR